MGLTWPPALITPYLQTLAVILPLLLYCPVLSARQIHPVQYIEYLREKSRYIFFFQIILTFALNIFCFTHNISFYDIYTPFFCFMHKNA